MATIAEGKQAPNFTLDEASGKRVALDDFRGGNSATSATHSRSESWSRSGGFIEPPIPALPRSGNGR